MERIETSDEGGPNGAPACSLLAKDLEPCQLVIFGATGDLTARKLIPALFALFRGGNLPKPCSIIGCGRTALDNDGFRQRLAENSPADLAGHPRWDEFTSFLHYRTVQYESPQSYGELAAFLKELDKRGGTGGNTIFDLAVPPDLYPVISAQLIDAGLAGENDVGRGWTRIIVEKPFGHDLASAKVLDAALHRGFSEQQIFRIDHYLAKETVQNTMMFRFANSIFEPLWNRDYIDHVGIVSAEELGVGTRAGYYDRAGVLRDMFQNHMLQLLAMIGMEPPAGFTAERIRDEKTRLLGCLRPFTAPGQEDALVLGQYGPGRIKGRAVAGYRRENGVRADSLTPTFAMLRVYLDNRRWQEVPFYLISGKRMARKDTRLVIQFKEVPHSMFREVIGGKVGANRLTFGIFPDEEINLSFQAKVPGPRICLRTTDLGFKYYDDAFGPLPTAYEKVLLDCMQGEQMFFWRQDGVELAWAFLDPVLEICEQCDDRKARLKFYEAGSWGPEEARGLMDDLMG
ncbi:MAG: glucose-6-phosphate dehydrogenase [Desulfurivibrionaceae bacterium]|nr:glucose-6-phosphate dehydrogenase [Desulfurivibrionaceae bacterium]